MANILGIGQSALAAAQVGIATTGHNIANASTPGYNRQELLQTAAVAQTLGGTFVGQGVSVGQVRRVYNEFLGRQVNSIQTTSNYASTYLAQINQISNLVADTTTGISPALQDFFSSTQNLASSPNGTAGAAARQSVLSSAESLVARFQSLQTRLDQTRENVNDQIVNSITSINGIATQIASLNASIERVSSAAGSPPNDLLDQRDQLVTELSKFTSVSVVPQGSKFNVFIGTGQPLVIGDGANSLQASNSLTDPSRIEVAFQNNGTLIQLPESSLNGGQLGALFSFRSSTLDVAQNSLGRVAIGIATSFNAQHKLGQDLNGQQGVDFFSVGSPISTPSANNTTSAAISATITDVSALTTSDYRVQFSGGNYTITRLSDGVNQTTSSLPIVIDGVSFNLTAPPSPAPANGDEFLVRPTANGASALGVALRDPSRIAAATGVTTAVPTTNTGSGRISSGSINSLIATGSTSSTATISAARLGNNFNLNSYGGPITLTFSSAAGGTLTGFPAGANVAVTVGNVTTNYPPPATVPYTSGANISVNGINFAITDGASPPSNGDTFTLANSLPVAANRLTYNSATNSLSGFPATANVTVTNGTTTTTYPAGATVPFIAGSTVSFQGQSFVVSGVPNNGDVFDITPNTNGTADNRNAILLSGLQSKNILINGSSTAQGAYGQLVSLVGNRAHELEVTSESESKLLEQAIQTQQSDSGVNLDEEAANLLRYQQAYQAAAKLLQIAGQLFDALLSIG